MAAAGTGEGAHYTEARLSSLVASQDLEAWNVFARDVLEEVAPSEASAAAVACALHQLRVAARTNLAFAIDAGKALLAAAAHRGAGWGAVLFDVREAVAEWCVRAGDEAQAQELWRAMLPAETGTVTLRLLTNFLNSAIRTRSYAVAETECLRGLSTYKALSMRPEANNEVNNFLLAFASLLAARRRFVEAAQRFYELYLRTKVLSHLREAIVCVIQADASAARSRLLKTLYKDESAVLLGELHTILSRACHTHLLRPSELQRFLPYVEPSADASAAVERAFIQHNLQAISRVYYNIGFTELGALLGITASEAERLVAQMVSERRLDASLDQTTDTVFFSRSDNASSLEAWDAKITSVCEELACVADLIVRQHAEFNEYLLLK
ncbi:putative cop9 signalosome complex subunit [Trypanosoma grayi]|uniref:putative cop9 signalosome complex subunit n=1 Tax=Trypanosoma grayi TaxID=71804 RepID=UPI0004F42FC6|nr:putative cop9 signalosome complex subunit [Trypanosoma grayi]KEG10290.1 putative cop9 signalosome complex subunit [Trypanosoma grayi]